MSEMAFTESLLLQKGHFLSSKRGCSFKKYFFCSQMGHFSTEKRFTFKLFAPDYRYTTQCNVSKIFMGVIHVGQIFIV